MNQHLDFDQSRLVELNNDLGDNSYDLESALPGDQVRVVPYARKVVKSWKIYCFSKQPDSGVPWGGETKQRGEQKGGGEQRKREGGEEGGGEKDEEEEASLASSVKGAKKRAFVIRRGCLRG